MLRRYIDRAVKAALNNVFGFCGYVSGYLQVLAVQVRCREHCVSLPRFWSSQGSWWLQGECRYLYHCQNVTYSTPLWLVINKWLQGECRYLYHYQNVTYSTLLWLVINKWLQGECRYLYHCQNVTYSTPLWLVINKWLAIGHQVLDLVLTSQWGFSKVGQWGYEQFFLQTVKKQNVKRYKRTYFFD